MLRIPDTDAEDLLAWEETRSPAPAEYLRDFWYLPTDRSAYVRVDFNAGRYAWDWGYCGGDYSAVEFTVE